MKFSRSLKKEDNKLIAYKGKCNSNEYSNKNKKGILFLGNISGRYINFTIKKLKWYCERPMQYDITSVTLNLTLQNPFRLTVK